MMQRSGPLYLALGLAGATAGYFLVDPTLALVAGTAVAAGSVAGAIASRRPRPRATVRPAARVARPVRRAPAPAMEPAHAALLAPDPHAARLRLTGDILRGMQTGGKTTRGRCSRCSATLWLSARRPLKATCPSCGHTRVLQ